MKPNTRDRPVRDMNNELWRLTLEELRLQMTKATYQTWLAHSYVIDSTSLPAGFVVAVYNDYAKEWLTHRLQGIVNRTVSAIAGRPLTVNFVAKPYPEEDLIMLGWISPNGENFDQPSGDEPLPHSIRQTRHIDRLLARAGIIPTYAIEIPHNITLDDILLRGGRDPMTAKHNPIRVRIYSHITKSTFLHVEDALSIGKLRLFAGSFKRGKGITANAHHFLDTADARVILLALSSAEPGFAYGEYKGSVNDGTDVISRELSVKAKDDHVYIKLKNGPGRLTNTGIIQPNGKLAAEITILFKAYEARRLAGEVLAYLHAWDGLRQAAHRELISGFPPYLLAPPPLDGSPAESIDSAPDSQPADAETAVFSGEPSPQTVIEGSVGAERSSALVSSINDDKVDVTKRQRQISEEPVRSDPAPTPPGRLLHYQDGTLVDPSNGNERNAFLQYRKDNGEDPRSLTMLRSWYGQRGSA